MRLAKGHCSAGSEAMTAINSQSRVLSFRLRTPYLKRSCHSEIVRGPIGPVKLTRGRIHVAASTPLREEPSLQPQEPQKNETQTVLRNQKTLERRRQRLREQTTYQIAAIAATSGIGFLGVIAIYGRISWHLQQGEDFPFADLGATLLLALGGMIGMEMYARWAHKHFWHENELGWAFHESHHVPRLGPFEKNDIFAVVNAVPAMGLCLYGFLRPDVVGGLCFGAGLGITLFGVSYMVIHDGLVHKRFPVGPIADVPQLKKIAIAHKLHHSEKYKGIPFGLFLGPQELEAVGAGPELERLLAASLAEENGKTPI